MTFLAAGDRETVHDQICGIKWLGHPHWFLHVLDESRIESIIQILQLRNQYLFRFKRQTLVFGDIGDQNVDVSEIPSDFPDESFVEDLNTTPDLCCILLLKEFHELVLDE